jgi:hypothetical protein
MARLSNRVHSFYVEIDSSAERKPTEPGIKLVCGDPGYQVQTESARPDAKGLLHIGSSA